MMFKLVRYLCVLSLLALVALFAGCAGAPPQAEQEQPPKQQEEAVEPKAEVKEQVEAEKKDIPRKAIVPQPPTTAQYWSQALMSHEDGEYAQALQNVVKVRRTKPDYPGARQLETKLRFLVGDAKGGLPLLEEMIRRGEGGAGVIHTFASWSAKSGQVSNAQNVLEELIGTGDNADPDMVASLAWLYQSVGDQKEAYELFSLIEGTPQADTFVPFIVQARFATGDYDGVRELYRIGAAKGADLSLQVQLAMADVNRLEGRASAAEYGYMQVLDAAPENYWAKVNLGLLRLGQGDAKGARTLLEASTSEHPDNPEAWCNLGLAHRKLGEHDKALAAYEKALEVDPNHPQTLKNIGILWEKYFAEPAKGMEFYDKYLEIVGTDEEVQRWHKAASRMVGRAQ